MSEVLYDVDFKVVQKAEGNLRLNGYIPHCTAKSVKNKENHVCYGKKEGTIIGHSSITIGYGVDLGQWNEAALKQMKLSADLVKKLQPYLGKKSAEDLGNLAKLTLESKDAKLLSEKVKDYIISQIVKRYEKDTNSKFNTLSKNIQTAIVSYFYQFGPFSMNLDAHSDYWNALVNNDWTKAVDFLDGQDDYIDRREVESALITKSPEYLNSTKPVLP